MEKSRDEWVREEQARVPQVPLALELCRDGGAPPEIVFGWSNEPPLAANLNFLLLGEGNIPWMVKELVRRAAPEASRQPRIVIG